MDRVTGQRSAVGGHAVDIFDVRQSAAASLFAPWHSATRGSFRECASRPAWQLRDSDGPMVSTTGGSQHDRQRKRQ
jgi:hypothetical protein